MRSTTHLPKLHLKDLFGAVRLASNITVEPMRPAAGAERAGEGNAKAARKKIKAAKSKRKRK